MNEEFARRLEQESLELTMKRLETKSARLY